MRLLSALAASVTLAGCSMNLQLMARTDGKVYVGHLAKTSGFSGTLSINISGRIYNGTWVVVPQGTTMLLLNQYGRVTTGTGMQLSNPATAILSSTDGQGLRCDMYGSVLGATGICADDTGKIYDMIAS